MKGAPIGLCILWGCQSTIVSTWVAWSPQLHQLSHCYLWLGPKMVGGNWRACNLCLLLVCGCDGSYGRNMDIDYAINNKRIDMGAKPYTCEKDNRKKWMTLLSLASGWDEL